ncbi:hypothetical protein [Macrococcus armenti]|uniref:hypothetical protein n=1 Tax=Macrococcus armenti TaxID=2875764 RepID=UPI001CD3ACF1|nr:hypothetical protein [Macrococcus armenti]UBH10083.1 hypothetical protein LAU38_07290 [Macrococcus armenti]
MEVIDYVLSKSSKKGMVILNVSHNGGIPFVLLKRSHVNDNVSLFCPEYDVKGVQLLVKSSVIKNVKECSK